MISSNLYRHLLHFSTISLIGFISLCFSPVSLAGIYKWVDEEGNVHYGQQRPSNANSERMQVQTHAPRDTSSYKRPGDKDDADKDSNETQTDDKTAVDQEKKPESKAEKKRRLAACAQARKNLSTMESTGRIRSKDKEGNTSYLSQKQKEDRMKRARNLISKHCK